MRFSFVAFLFVCGVACLPTGARAEEDWQASRTWVIGCDSQVWVIGSADADGDQLPVIQMWHANKGVEGAMEPKPSRFLPAISGDPLLLGADDTALRVLFANLTSWSYYADRDSSPWVSWRDQSDSQPLAWAGDATETTFLALAWAQALIAETKGDAASQPVASTQPASETFAETPAETFVETPAATLSATSTGLSLLRYHSGKWHRTVAPSEAEAGTEFWLSGRNDEAHLFWNTKDRGIFTATWSQGIWSAPVLVVANADINAAWAGASVLGPVFIIGVPAASSERADNPVRLHIFLREGDGWSDAKRVSEGTEYLTIDAATCGVGIACDRLVIAKPAAPGTIEFGVGDLGVSPSVSFTTLALRREVSPGEMTWRNVMTLAMMFGLMMLVFVSRRDQLTQAVIVPKGFALAAIWRRALATFMDLMPAVLLASPLVLLLLGDRFQDPMQLYKMMQDASEGGAIDQNVLNNMELVRLITVGLYGVWCLAWELGTRTTPGKLILGCRVIGTRGERATTRQIVVRNLIRIVVFSLGEVGIIAALMTMVIVSRNRQRLGDLMANTIVISPEVPIDENGRDPNRPSGPSQ